MSMRKKANWSLILLVVAFIIILVVRHFTGETNLLQALLFIVEAGMVGALADWFAVTALFRHPLGLKFIPHTAIIPRNKNKLIEGVVKLVEEQLLDRQLIANKLNNVSIVQTVIDQVGNNPLDKMDDMKLKKLIVKVASSVITTTNTAKLEARLENLILEAKLSKWLSLAIRLAQKKQWDDNIINKLLTLMHERLCERDILQKITVLLQETTNDMTEANFFKRLLFKAAEAINAVNINDAAAIIYHDLLQLVHDMKDDEHPVRQLMKSHLNNLADHLDEQDDINAVLRVWLLKFIDELKLQAWVPEWLQQFFTFTDEHTGTKTVELLARLVKKLLHAAWSWFIANDVAQHKVETYIKSFLSYLIQYEYKLVGEVVQATLSSFTDERLVEFIESKVETDLQRIRLNGAVVGACIGALIYLFLYGVYAPLLSLL